MPGYWGELHVLYAENPMLCAGEPHVLYAENPMLCAGENFTYFMRKTHVVYWGGLMHFMRKAPCCVLGNLTYCIGEAPCWVLGEPHVLYGGNQHAVYWETPCLVCGKRGCFSLHNIHLFGVNSCMVHGKWGCFSSAWLMLEVLFFLLPVTNNFGKFSPHS